MQFDLEEMNKLVIELTGNPSQAKVWWNSPNKAFGDKIPMEVWRTNPEHVHTYLTGVFFGAW